MLLYDNIEDVKTKLIGTYVYYDGKAMFCKDCSINEKEKFVIGLMAPNARNRKWVELDDPKLNYMNFNLGYTNGMKWAVWWYRIPQRQYRQGLRHDQVGMLASNDMFKHYAELNFNKPTFEMMENIYPKFEEIFKPLQDGHANIMAFHKDFAATWDKFHKDLIIEYKGTQFASFKKDFEIVDEYAYLTEALKEAVG